MHRPTEGSPSIREFARQIREDLDTAGMLEKEIENELFVHSELDRIYGLRMPDDHRRTRERVERFARQLWRERDHIDALLRTCLLVPLPGE